jgi:hypothetical protein
MSKVSHGESEQIEADEIILKGFGYQSRSRETEPLIYVKSMRSPQPDGASALLFSTKYHKLERLASRPLYMLIIASKLAPLLSK